MTDDETMDRVAEVHEHLAATQELPVETAASRWLGEAEAVAADLVDDDVPEDVVRERMGHVLDLLANVEETGHPEADEHVRMARATVADLLDHPDRV